MRPSFHQFRSKSGISTHLAAPNPRRRRQGSKTKIRPCFHSDISLCFFVSPPSPLGPLGDPPPALIAPGKAIHGGPIWAAGLATQPS